MVNKPAEISKAHCVLYHLDDFRADPEYISRVKVLRPDYEPNREPLGDVDHFLRTMCHCVACGCAVGLVGAFMVMLSIAH